MADPYFSPPHNWLLLSRIELLGRYSLLMVKNSYWDLSQFYTLNDPGQCHSLLLKINNTRAIKLDVLSMYPDEVSCQRMNIGILDHDRHTHLCIVFEQFLELDALNASLVEPHVVDYGWAKSIFTEAQNVLAPECSNSTPWHAVFKILSTSPAQYLV